MNFITSYISKIFSGFFKKRYGTSYTRDPIRDWQHLLVGASALVLVILVLEGYFFYQVNTGRVYKADGPRESALPVLNRTDIERVNTFYDAKQKKIDSLKTTPPVTIDPVPYSAIVTKPSP